jgi:hypothetical protein
MAEKWSFRNTVWWRFLEIIHLGDWVYEKCLWVRENEKVVVWVTTIVTAVNTGSAATIKYLKGAPIWQLVRLAVAAEIVVLTLALTIVYYYTKRSSLNVVSDNTLSPGDASQMQTVAPSASHLELGDAAVLVSLNTGQQLLMSILVRNAHSEDVTLNNVRATLTLKHSGDDDRTSPALFSFHLGGGGIETNKSVTLPMASSVALLLAIVSNVDKEFYLVTEWRSSFGPKLAANDKLSSGRCQVNIVIRTSSEPGQVSRDYILQLNRDGTFDFKPV